MRGCFKAALAFGLVAALAAPAMAQGRGGFGGMGMGGPVNLLGNPGVQKELKLDDGPDREGHGPRRLDPREDDRGPRRSSKASRARSG